MAQADEFVRILEENGAVDGTQPPPPMPSSLLTGLPSNRLELWFLMESQRLLRPAFREFYKEREAATEEYRERAERNPRES